jgi:hypothetical protein
MFRQHHSPEEVIAEAMIGKSEVWQSIGSNMMQRRFCNSTMPPVFFLHNEEREDAVTRKPRNSYDVTILPEN